jgi:hypothetical protein
MMPVIMNTKLWVSVRINSQTQDDDGQYSIQLRKQYISSMAAASAVKNSPKLDNIKNMQRRTTGTKQQGELAAKKNTRLPQKQLNIWKTPERKWCCMDMRMLRYLPSQGTKCFIHLLFKIIYSMSLPYLLGSLQKMMQNASIALYETKIITDFLILAVN